MPGELRILAWNVESGGNDPNVIVNQLHELSGYDIVGLTEVRASSIKKYVDALSASDNTFLSINTATGGIDRIILAYTTRSDYSCSVDMRCTDLVTGCSTHKAMMVDGVTDHRWWDTFVIVNQAWTSWLLSITWLGATKTYEEGKRLDCGSGLKLRACLCLLLVITTLTTTFMIKQAIKRFSYSLRTMCGNGCGQRN
jgi:hypothetical protein